MDFYIQCLSAFIGCLGFAFVFRIHKNIHFALLGSLGGTIGWICFVLLVNSFHPILANLIAMMGVSLYSELMARYLKAPATIFIVVGCFPLVPGKGIYQTMLYLISNDRSMFLNSLLETIGIALALATAILIISTVFKVIKNIKNLRYRS